MKVLLLTILVSVLLTILWNEAKGYFSLYFYKISETLLLNSILFSYVIVYEHFDNKGKIFLQNFKKTFSKYDSFKAFILAPIIEELFFRLIFESLRKRLEIDLND